MFDKQVIQDKLITRAGLTEEIIRSGKICEDFDSICEALQLIHAGKSVLYGDYMKTHAGDAENWGLAQHFMDLKRKYVRAENFIEKKMEGEDIDLNELLDTYSDMAVYSIMGVQVLFKYLGERQQNEHERPITGNF